MPVQTASLIFTEAEQALGHQLLKLAEETDRIEGYREAHAVFIAQLAEMLAELCGLRGSDLTAVKFAALAHDLGERVMKREYLQHPGALTWDERLDLWRHPILGEQAAAQRGLSRQAQLLIRWHHEWWNGFGYPDALAGEAIPLGARIIRVADSYSALIADRPYRQRLDEEAVQQIIADQAGLEFDPHVVQAILDLPIVKERVRSPEFGVRSFDRELRSLDLEHPSLRTEIHMPNLEIQTQDVEMQSSNSEPQPSSSELRTPNSEL
jgi:HD-GYP domain-containing protein (c-di-GMP phosphodiesterase class II)